MAVIILAGGESKRMAGADKAFLMIGKESIIKRQVRLLKKFFKEIIIVTNSTEKYKGFKGVKIIPDIIPHQGPLAGILSGLIYSGDHYNFVVACDMPFLNPALIKHIIREAKESDILVPRINGKVHPLLGVYTKNCIGAIKEALAKNKLRVQSIFKKVKTNFLSRQEMRRFDKDLLSLVNLNTPKDLEILK